MVFECRKMHQIAFQIERGDLIADYFGGLRRGGFDGRADFLNFFCTSLGQFAIYSSIEATLQGSMSSPCF